MRALCGALITAGALIGLGLTALGIGTRYQNFAKWGDNPESYRVKFLEMDTGLVFAVVVLTLAALIGLAIAFLGLAYHHHRRRHELGLHRTGDGTAPSPVGGRPVT
jgi:hypothetical protein